MNAEERCKEFSDCATMKSAIDLVKEKEVRHNTYSFYTFLDRVKQMLTGEHPCMWLTRIDSELFDDLIECKKFGSRAPKKQSKTFIKCFSYGLRESAAMWGLYCPPTYKAIRVTVSKQAMESLRNSQCYRIIKDKISHKGIYATKEFTAVIYAAVKSNDEEADRSNNLYWKGIFSKKIHSLSKDRCSAAAAGRIKDIEWSFENESRLIVTTTDGLSSDHMAIGLTADFIKSMRFTLSPWINEDEELFVRRSLVEWFKIAGRKGVIQEDEDVFKKSALKGALAKWAQRRGLD